MSALVLIVDDEVEIRESLTWLLEAFPHAKDLRIETAASCESALPLVEKAPPRVAVVSDYNLGAGAMDGLTFLTRVRAMRPNARLVLMSGYAIEELARANLAPLDWFLPKPFEARELLDALGAIVQGDPEEPGGPG